MDFGQLLAALIPLAFIIHWAVDGLKDITNKNVNGVLTKGVSWVGAFGVCSLYAHSSLDLGGTHGIMSSLGWSDLVLLGMAVAAGGGTLADAFRTFNTADGTTQSTLVPPE